MSGTRKLSKQEKIALYIETVLCLLVGAGIVYLSMISDKGFAVVFLAGTIFAILCLGKMLTYNSIYKTSNMEQKTPIGRLLLCSGIPFFSTWMITKERGGKALPYLIIAIIQTILLAITIMFKLKPDVLPPICILIGAFGVLGLIVSTYIVDLICCIQLVLLYHGDWKCWLTLIAPSLCLFFISGAVMHFVNQDRVRIHDEIDSDANNIGVKMIRR